MGGRVSVTAGGGEKYLIRKTLDGGATHDVRADGSVDVTTAGMISRVLECAMMRVLTS